MEQSRSKKDKVPPAPATLATEVDSCRELCTLYNILKTNESRLERAVEAASAGTWSLDPATNTFWVNRTVRHIFAFPDGTEITLPMFMDRVHPADRATITATIQHVLTGAQNVNVEYRIVHPDGTVRWIHSRGGLYVLDDGKSSCIMGASVDITAKKESEQVIARHLQFEELITETSATLISHTTPEQLDQTIVSILGKVNDFFQGDRCGLIRCDLEHHVTSITHGFYREGLVRVPPDTDLITPFPYSYEMIRQGEHFCFSDLSEVPPAAAVDRQSWLARGVVSCMQIPLYFNETIRYLFLVQSLSQRLFWDTRMLCRLKILGEVLINAIYRNKIEEELKRSCAEIGRLKEKLQVEADYLRAEVLAAQSADKIIGQSEPLQKVLTLVEQVAPTTSTVLISGETGTGKELIAQAIHNHSSRHDKVLVKVNCASLPSSLIESELFGREKGAYTGALTRQVGRFELANNSTLFLDEISEMSLELQAKLLRVLQEGEFERLGSSTTIKVDVRILAATNRNLMEEVTKGRFRNDLYYRLNVFPIVVPPLRERADDVPMLAWEFIRELNEKMGKKIRKIAAKDMALLQSYAWPGNVRELRNVIEYGAIVSTGEELKVRLPKDSTENRECRASIAEMERNYIQSILKQTNWRIKGAGGAAQILGMNPSTLYFRMKKLGIDAHRPLDDL